MSMKLKVNRNFIVEIMLVSKIFYQVLTGFLFPTSPKISMLVTQDLLTLLKRQLRDSHFIIESTKYHIFSI